MKVLLLFTSSHLGGAERSLTRMALSSTGVDYQLATLDGEGPWCDWVRSHGHEPWVYGEEVGLIRRLVRIVRDIKRSSIDIVYVCGVRASLMMRFLLLLLPHVNLIHGVRWNPNTNSRLDLFFRLVERTTNKLVDAWITNSAAAKKTLVTRCQIPSQKVHIIYNGLETAPTNIPPIRERAMEVLTVANLNPRKGYLEYLSVIRKVVQQIPEARFIFIGRDDMDGKVQQAIVKEGLSDIITWLGFQEDVSPWLKRARVFALPSLWGEGCPTSILEANAYMLPVVAYSIDGIPELIENDFNGILATPYNQGEFANAIIKILSDEKIAQIMGRSGRERVEKNFSLKSCIEEHHACFSTLASKRKRT